MGGDEKEKQGISNNFNTLFFGRHLNPPPLPLEAERKRGGERKRSRESEREETGERRTEINSITSPMTTICIEKRTSLRIILVVLPTFRALPK